MSYIKVIVSQDSSKIKDYPEKKAIVYLLNLTRKCKELLSQKPLKIQ